MHLQSAKYLVAGNWFTLNLALSIRLLHPALRT